MVRLYKVDRKFRCVGRRGEQGGNAAATCAEKMCDQGRQHPPGMYDSDSQGWPHSVGR